MDIVLTNVISNIVSNFAQFMIQLSYKKRSSVKDQINICKQQLHDHASFILSYRYIPVNRESLDIMTTEHNENSIVKSLIRLNTFSPDADTTKFIRKTRLCFLNLRRCHDYSLQSELSNLMLLMNEIITQYCKGGD
jgi:hypothetical protein